jgi:hypothetical protein
MIRKVALVAAIREAFAMGGYDEAEMSITAPVEAHAEARTAQTAGPQPRTVQVITHEPTAKKPTPAAFDPIPPAERISPVTAARLTDLMARAQMSEYQRNVALNRRGVDRVEDLDEVAATTMINKLEATLSVAEWDPLAGEGQKEGKEADRPAEVPIPLITPTSTPPPRARQPGDDDEPFDDATGKVLTDPAEIAAEFDRSAAEVFAATKTPTEKKPEKKPEKKEKTTTAPVAG